jgi:hypothetical protein
MENNQQSILNLANYKENYIYKLIDLSFQFYDSHIDKEKFEEDIDLYIREFPEFKPNETKLNIKSLTDFIEKYSNAEESYLEENLLILSIS